MVINAVASQLQQARQAVQHYSEQDNLATKAICEHIPSEHN